MGAWGYFRSRPMLIAFAVLAALAWYQAASGNISSGTSMTAKQCGATLSEAETLTASGSLGKLSGTLIVPTLAACRKAGWLSELEVKPYVR